MQEPIVLTPMTPWPKPTETFGEKMKILGIYTASIVMGVGIMIAILMALWWVVWKLFCTYMDRICRPETTNEEPSAGPSAGSAKPSAADPNQTKSPPKQTVRNKDVK